MPGAPGLSVAAEVTRLHVRIIDRFQSASSRRLLRDSDPVAAEVTRLRRCRAFTLIELIFVMLLLAVAAAMVAPRMSSFFRGRALNFEARRMLTLTHYAQSQAVARSVPVLLWVNARAGTYGIEAQGAHATPEDRAPSYTIDPSLTLVVPVSGAEPVSELDDERLGAPEGLPVIRFNPDGFLDEISIPKIVLQLDPEQALEIGQKPNRLGYEIRPATGPN